ncbi:MAG TPA: PQQ-binding-like beta-propeller repeat protein [Tepidisphaeraceae bacterium]|nr:PQQ-binding-like beta-propeller repeat protein [Tepidisphaeraceae bacterium]
MTIPTPIRLGLFSLAASLSFCISPALAGDWPQFLGPTRNGVYADADVTATFPDAGPKVLWKQEVGHGFAGPVVSSGKLVLFHRIDEKECVQCFDAKTGKSIWKSEYPTDYNDDFGFDDGPRATPTIAGGKIYTFGASGMLACWDLATGKQIWAVDTRKTFKSPKGYFGRACSPLVEGDAVIMNIGAEGAGIVAFDKETGKTLWKATDDAASYSSPVAATISGKRYVFVFTRAGLAAIDPATGKVYFDFHFRSRMDASVNAATPLVIGDTIFLSASYGTGAALLKFDEAGPKEIWSGDNILSNHYATSVESNGFLYGFNGRQEQGPSLTCVELKTGKVRWTEDHYGAGTILLAGGKLLVLSEKGELQIAPASPVSFKPTAHAQVLAFNSRAYPALADGLLYARSTTEMVCVDLRAGKAK